jgi:hypothetical protein
MTCQILDLFAWIKMLGSGRSLDTCNCKHFELVGFFKSEVKFGLL